MFDKGDGNILLRPEFNSARLARRGRQAGKKSGKCRLEKWPNIFSETLTLTYAMIETK